MFFISFSHIFVPRYTKDSHLFFVIRGLTCDFNSTFYAEFQCVTCFFFFYRVRLSSNARDLVLDNSYNSIYLQGVKHCLKCATCWFPEIFGFRNILFECPVVINRHINAPFDLVLQSVAGISRAELHKNYTQWRKVHKNLCKYFR